ncbi:hypothetical protein A0H81_14093 [Grifola frondosa]|uniref:Secreted protein n=1 Tax=Grifola frondosa TaxID=5627 RepID=A0A1C7LM81_GRIFR|nr:hypothetical protein A0H81_14093 [Grifola frondosa]
MLTTVLSTRQPRWVLLSVFLVLWSWCPSLRRDGRLKAFGFGVEAQVGIPLCAVECASRGGCARVWGGPESRLRMPF